VTQSGQRNGQRPLLVAHRGDRHEAPENTLTAFEVALANGADAIELDVQVARDQVPVVIHDERLDRTTNGSGAVRDHSWAELCDLDAGSWHGSAFAGERIPSLEDALAWAEERQVPVLVELKTHPELDHDAGAALAELFGTRPWNGVTLYSSDHVLVSELSRLLPQIKRGIILNEHTPLLSESVRATGSSLLSQTIWCLTSDTVADAHALGCLVSAEVRHPLDVPRLLAWDVDLLVTERLSVSEVRVAVDGALLAPRRATVETRVR
jgi:glycerophosphoryl diester phosphodiesterase